MSLHTAAKYLQSHGRGPDDQLVHMSSNEVKGLQALAKAHGGSLSINPKTGLAEAGFLDNLLPTIIGVGLAATGVGAPMAALMVGGGTALMTGDINKGLMAGLGAYGGAGMGAGLEAAAGAGAGAGTTATQTLGSTAGEFGTKAAVDSGTQAIANATGNANALTTQFPYQTATGTGQVAPAAANLGGAAPTTTATQTPGMFDKLKTMYQGVGNLGDEKAREAAYKNLPMGTLPALGLTAANVYQDLNKPQTPGTPEEDPRYKGSPYRYNLAKNFTGSTPVQPNPYYRPTGLGYAAGGDIMMAAGGSYDDEPRGDDQGFGFAVGGALKMGEGIARDTDEDTASLNAFDAAKKRVAKVNKAANMPKKYAAQMPQVRGLGELAAAQGGSIGGYSDGGRMLKGPGDGMSDSIPAVIGKKQPARLADGEFVVPADVVSHLGNGSTDAGAKRLYGMMDKVRQARTGKKKQAPAVKAEKYLPA